MTGWPPPGEPSPHTTPDSPRPDLTDGSLFHTVPDSPRPNLTGPQFQTTVDASGPMPTGLETVVDRLSPKAPSKPPGKLSGRLLPFRDDDVTRGRALLVARIVVTLYIVELLVNMVRPKALPDEPTLSVFQESVLKNAPKNSGMGSLDTMMSMPRIVFWAVLAGIVAGVLMQVYANVTRPEGRRAVLLTWATVATLVGPFGLLTLSVLVTSPGQALICVPSTAFVLWLLHVGQRFARLPLAMLLLAFGWGSLIVFGLSRAFSNLAFGSIYGYLVKGAEGDLTQLTKARYRAMDFLLLHMSVVIALVVAAGVLLLMLLFRHRIHDALTGMVLGASVGLGYTFVESVLLIKIYGMLGGITGTTAGFEYWIRQSIGLLGGQVTFGALLGAGIGLAFQTRDRQRRKVIVGWALAASIGGAAATETLAGWFSTMAHDHVSTGGAFDTLIVSPFLWLLPQAPFMVVTVLILLAARRSRASAARTAVAAEAVAGTAITRTEAPYLIDPSLRIWALANTWRAHGRDTAVALLRLQSAQLELAGTRLRQPGEADDTAAREEGDRLRTKVMELKNGSGSAVTR